MFIAITIIGIFLGFMFHRFFFCSNVFHGPQSKEIVEPIFYEFPKKKCYKFEIQTFVCPPSLSASLALASA
jgi:hypothetical protein